MSDKRYLGNIITPTPTAPAGPYQDSAAKGVWSLQEAYTYIKAGLWPTAGNQLPLIEDVFSTYLYTGNGSTQTITNGIDLAGEGGLVWIKSRSAATNNFLFDTERGTTDEINSNTTDAEASLANSLTAFNADGFSISSATGIGVNAATYASWTFRKAPRFFDVVTYTGTGSARTVSHNLGLAPGCIMVKRTDSTGDWIVYHRSNTANPETDYLELNDTAATADDNTMWNDTAPTATVFTVGTDADVNASAATYVAYLFAHDPLGPSGDGSDGLIACGSYTGNGSTDGPEINLGWEPQWVLIKNASGAYGWVIWDSMRGIADGGDAASLYPNVSNAENAFNNAVKLTPTGFKFTGTGAFYNASGNTYIYIAIRRGPMREPTSGTEVFDTALYTGNATDRTIDFSSTMQYADMGIWRARTGGTNQFNQEWWTVDRLRGMSSTSANSTGLRTASTDSESTGGPNNFINDTYTLTSGTSLNVNSATFLNYMFRRAPGFFDVVAYTGTGANRTVDHNLGVVPELIIVKGRTNTQNWPVYAAPLGNSTVAFLNVNNAVFTGQSHWNSTTPTSSVFSLGNTAAANESAQTFIAYLFATLPGVSKVGSYTGNGSSQTIDCGFTSGARFVLIKRTDSTGDWYVWDSARGIVAGNDPHLSLNTTAAEVTTDDSVDAESSGFIVNQDAATNVNVATASYIFLAVA